MGSSAISSFEPSESVGSPSPLILTQSIQNHATTIGKDDPDRPMSISRAISVTGLTGSLQLSHKRRWLKERLSTVKILWSRRFPPEPVKTSWISQQSDPSHLDRPYVITVYLSTIPGRKHHFYLVSTYIPKIINRVLRIKNENYLQAVKFHFSFVGY